MLRGTLQELFDPSSIGMSELSTWRIKQGRDDIIPEQLLALLADYEEIDRWYTGNALAEVIEDATGQPYELYPLRLNPFPLLVSKHVHAVMGIAAPGTPPVQHKAQWRPRASEETRNRLNDIINRLIMSLGGASRIGDAVRMANIYGGVGIRARLRATPDGIEPVWEILHPKTFIVVPKPNYVDMEEAWIVRYITPDAARKLGAKIDDDAEIAVYVEHWTEERIEIFVDGEAVKGTGPNPFGFVPVVYIPHVRAGRFWGESLIMPLVGLVKELNRRFADFGDATKNDAERVIAVRNASVIKTDHILGGIPIVRLEGDASVFGNKTQPDMFEVSSRGHASQPMSVLVNELWNAITRGAHIPPIAFGEDEGSQRSSLTLVTRFWPLISHADEERRYWTDGLRQLSILTLKMLEKKARSLAPIWVPPKGWDEIDIAFVWSEQLPRDAEALVEVVARRWEAGIGAPESLLELLPDVDNPDDEVRRIKEWMLFLAELERLKRGGNPGRPDGKPSASQRETSNSMTQEDGNA